MMRILIVCLFGILAMTVAQPSLPESNSGLTQEQGWAMELITVIFSWLFKMADKAPAPQPTNTNPAPVPAINLKKTPVPATNLKKAPVSPKKTESWFQLQHQDTKVNPTNPNTNPAPVPAINLKKAPVP